MGSVAWVQGNWEACFRVRGKGSHSRRRRPATAPKSVGVEETGGNKSQVTAIRHVGGEPQGSKAALEGARDSCEGKTLKGESQTAAA
jgi:hypothetical protein